MTAGKSSPSVGKPGKSTATVAAGGTPMLLDGDSLRPTTPAELSEYILITMSRGTVTTPGGQTIEAGK